VQSTGGLRSHESVDSGYTPLAVMVVPAHCVPLAAAVGSLPPKPAAPVGAPKDYIIFFGHNMADLLPEAFEVVRQAAAAAKSHGSASVAVAGHADRSGSDSYNEALSLRRATNVKAALVAEGIAEAEGRRKAPFSRRFPAPAPVPAPAPAPTPVPVPFLKRIYPS